MTQLAGRKRHVNTMMAVGLVASAVATSCGTGATNSGASGPSQGSSAVDHGSPLDSATGWIAYHRHGLRFPDDVAVYLIKTDGTEDHEIGADVAPEAIHHHPDWSRDGRQLLFDVQGEPDQLYVMNADGSDARIVTDCELPECVGATHASWSRDGKRIAAAYAIGPLGPEGPARLGLAIIDIESGARTVILDHDADDGQDLYPRWSSDDEQLVFWRERNDGTTAIFVIGVDGTDLTQLTEWDQFAGDPDWSPDGTQIVFTTYPLRVFGVAEESNLFTMRPDGTELRQLTHLEGSRATQPRWTPDGEAITYTRVEPGGRPRHIWVIRADGTDDTPVLTSTDNITHAVLQPSLAVSSAGAVSPSRLPGASAGAEAVAEAVDIGGRSLYLECRGTGEPTILFFHGDGGDRTHGYHLFDAYADRHTVCVYDRANMGLSDEVAGTQSGADVIADLEGLLDAADLPGPYLLVANSFGGLLAELFAAERPDQVAGMVLVDASIHADADVDRYFADRGELDLAAFEAEYARGPERIVWTIHDEARASLVRIPDIPITYLRASESGGLPPDAQAIWDAGLGQLLARSSNGQIVEVTGPHTLPPGPVHDAIDEVLADVE